MTMTDFFTISTFTPWDVNNNQLVDVRLLSLKSIFERFPVIEKHFFDDLISHIVEKTQYKIVNSIKRIVGPKNEDYDIRDWTFLWVFDKDGRMYQFLFQKVSREDPASQAILVALAPPELAKLFSKHKQKAIHRILSLINNPIKIKFLMLLAPQGKSIAEDYTFFQLNQKKLNTLKKNYNFANQFNVKGQWFPTFEPRCPICNEILTPIDGYRVGFGKLICPRCGYQAKSKK
ncbi:MAG: hypothetical protein GF353_01325 [Candidatus Lokiarchaeota archaeon]|nr:hypothetical protein [Candidatus Lokiarchaeota archaeon]